MTKVYTVIGKEDCAWCDRAMELLHEKNLPVDYISINHDPLLLPLLKLAKVRTVPLIFDDQYNYIGTYKDLVRHFEEKKLPEGRKFMKWDDLV